MKLGEARVHCICGHCSVILVKDAFCKRCNNKVGFMFYKIEGPRYAFNKYKEGWFSLTQSKMKELVIDDKIEFNRFVCSEF